MSIGVHKAVCQPASHARCKLVMYVLVAAAADGLVSESCCFPEHRVTLSDTHTQTDERILWGCWARDGKLCCTFQIRGASVPGLVPSSSVQPSDPCREETLFVATRVNTCFLLTCCDSCESFSASVGKGKLLDWVSSELYRLSAIRQCVTVPRQSAVSVSRKFIVSASDRK